MRNPFRLGRGADSPKGFAIEPLCFGVLPSSACLCGSALGQESVKECSVNTTLHPAHLGRRGSTGRQGWDAHTTLRTLTHTPGTAGSSLGHCSPMELPGTGLYGTQPRGRAAPRAAVGQRGQWRMSCSTLAKGHGGVAEVWSLEVHGTCLVQGRARGPGQAKATCSSDSACWHTHMRHVWALGHGVRV